MEVVMREVELRVTIGLKVVGIVLIEVVHHSGRCIV